MKTTWVAVMGASLAAQAAWAHQPPCGAYLESADIVFAAVSPDAPLAERVAEAYRRLLAGEAGVRLAGEELQEMLESGNFFAPPAGDSLRVQLIEAFAKLRAIVEARTEENAAVRSAIERIVKSRMDSLIEKTERANRVKKERAQWNPMKWQFRPPTPAGLNDNFFSGSRVAQWTDRWVLIGHGTGLMTHWLGRINEPRHAMDLGKLVRTVDGQTRLSSDGRYVFEKRDQHVGYWDEHGRAGSFELDGLLPDRWAFAGDVLPGTETAVIVDDGRLMKIDLLTGTRIGRFGDYEMKGESGNSRTITALPDGKRLVVYDGANHIYVVLSEAAPAVPIRGSAYAKFMAWDEKNEFLWVENKKKESIEIVPWDVGRGVVLESGKAIMPSETTATGFGISSAFYDSTRNLLVVLSAAAIDFFRVEFRENTPRPVHLGTHLLSDRSKSKIGHWNEGGIRLSSDRQTVYVTDGLAEGMAFRLDDLIESIQ